MIPQIAPKDVAAWCADPMRVTPVLVDVREPWEHERCRIGGSVLLPLAQLPARHTELPAERDVVLVCHHGGRSQQAAMWLAHNGHANVYNLRGGVDAWAIEVEPSMPRY